MINLSFLKYAEVCDMGGGAAAEGNYSKEFCIDKMLRANIILHVSKIT